MPPEMAMHDRAPPIDWPKIPLRFAPAEKMLRVDALRAAMGFRSRYCLQAMSHQRRLTTRLTAAATSTVLKKKETMPWTMLIARIVCVVTATSDVCAVIPVTKAK